SPENSEDANTFASSPTPSLLFHQNLCYHTQGQSALTGCESLRRRVAHVDEWIPVGWALGLAPLFALEAGLAPEERLAVQEAHLAAAVLISTYGAECHFSTPFL